MNQNELIKKIKKKKELKNIANSYVETEIASVLKQNPKFEEPKKEKILIKDVRSRLRPIFGIFQMKLNKREAALEQDDFLTILKTHASTKERLQIYPQLYSEIFAITKKPKSILDLGCGMNPFSFPFMNLKTVKYIASDISDSDLDFINRYFIKHDLPSETQTIDLRKPEESFKLKADICFMFKLLDSVETKGHKLAEEIITNLSCKWIVASFAKKGIKGTPMNHTYRGWIERMLDRINLKYWKLDYPDEIFYIIKK
jgi:16S rRNA (guanine(1405)-N(7))-methyltransferase